MISSWKYFILLIMCCIIIPVISLSARTDTLNFSQNDGPLRFSLIHNGIEREYYVWLPQNFDADQICWGLVIAHGGGSNNGRTFWLTPGIRQEADKAGLRAIIIAPTFLKDDPNAEQFPVLGGGTFLKQVLEDVRGKYKLHPKILLTGYSRGAQFAHRFALLNPDLVQACAPLSAGSWTTPDGHFFMYGLGKVESPELFLSLLQNSNNVSVAQKKLFNMQVAKVAGQSASPGAKEVSFLIMCGTVDVRFEIAQKFAGSLKELGYHVETAWPDTPHGDRNNKAYRSEFNKYAQETVAFFIRITKGE